MSICLADMSSAVTRRKIIIDTDPGVDDANAIIGALADDSAEIIALTTVAGNAGLFQVTKNLKKLLQVCGRTDVRHMLCMNLSHSSCTRQIMCKHSHI